MCEHVANGTAWATDTFSAFFCKLNSLAEFGLAPGSMDSLDSASRHSTGVVGFEQLNKRHHCEEPMTEMCQ